MPIKVNNTKFRQLITEFSDSLEKTLNNEPVSGKNGSFDINQATLKVQVTRYLNKTSTQEHVKKMLVSFLDEIQQDYQRKLYRMLLGTDSSRISQSFRAKVESAFPRGASRRTNAWINQVWGGDWYAYKRSLASRRLVKTGKKDKNGKDIYRVYAGRLGSKDEANKSFYFDVGQLKASDKASHMGKTLKSAKRHVIGDSKVDHTPGIFDLDKMTSQLNPAKIGKRASKATGIKEDKLSSYALTRSVLLADQLRNGVREPNSKAKQAISTKASKGGVPKGKIPYARTGRMAESLSDTFTIQRTGIKVGTATGTDYRLKVIVPGKFNINGMAAEYKRQYLRTPIIYRNLVIYYAGDLFSELLAKNLKGKEYNGTRK